MQLFHNSAFFVLDDSIISAKRENDKNDLVKKKKNVKLAHFFCIPGKDLFPEIPQCC